MKNNPRSDKEAIFNARHRGAPRRIWKFKEIQGEPPIPEEQGLVCRWPGQLIGCSGIILFGFDPGSSR